MKKKNRVGVLLLDVFGFTNTSSFLFLFWRQYTCKMPNVQNKICLTYLTYVEVKHVYYA